MENNKSLIVAICIFIIVGTCALLLILNKGHIGSINLVNTDVSIENKEKIVPKLKIEIEKEYLSSTKKEEAKITALVDEVEKTEDIVYTSSDEEIAKIENGKVIAVNDGKITITAEYNGAIDTEELQVITPIKSINFTSTSSSIRVGKELQMKLQVTPSDAYIGTLKYSSSDEEIATVNSNGIVTGVSKGKVTITVKDEYTGTEKSVNLTIK